MKLLPWSSQFPDLNPKENEWSELKRRSTNMELESEGSGEILYGGMVSDLSPNSSGIIEEDSELLSLEKDIAIIGCQ